MNFIENERKHTRTHDVNINSSNFLKKFSGKNSRSNCEKMGSFTQRKKIQCFSNHRIKSQLRLKGFGVRGGRNRR